MCGRVEIRYDQETFINILSEINKRWPGVDFKTGELYPSDLLPVLHFNSEQQYVADLIKWSYTLWNNKKVINARSETIEEKITFRKDFISRRVVIPVSGFYEWDERKNKYLYEDKKGSIMFLAGLINKEGSETIIMTRAAKKQLKVIHERCPVLIDHNACKKWMTDLDYARHLLLTPDQIDIQTTKL